MGFKKLNFLFLNFFIPKKNTNFYKKLLNSKIFRFDKLLNKNNKFISSVKLLNISKNQDVKDLNKKEGNKLIRANFFFSFFYFSPIHMFNSFLSKSRINFDLRSIRFGGKFRYIPSLVNPLKDIRFTVRNFIKGVLKNFQSLENLVNSIHYTFLNNFIGFGLLSSIRKKFYMTFVKNRLYMKFLIKRRSKNLILKSRRRRRKRIKRT